MLRHRSDFKTIFPICIHLIVYFLIFAKLYRPGYLITLDLQFTPNSNLGIIPAQLFQHLIWSFIFLGGSIGMYFLLGTITNLASPSAMPRLLAGLFYMYNPFTYQRFLAGHLYVLLGYAFTPLFIWLLTKPAKDQSARWLAISSLYILVSITTGHFVVIWGIIILAWLMIQLLEIFFKRQNTSDWFIAVGLFLLSLGLTLLITPNHQTTIAGFSLQEFYRYAGKPDPEHGLLYSILTLHGFWREGKDMLIINSSPFFMYSVIILGYLIALGIWNLWHQNKKLLIFLLTVYLTSLVLALGVGGPNYKLMNWLIDLIPWFSGMREIQKMSVNLALVYAILLGSGLSWLTQLFKKTNLARHLLLLVSALAWLGNMYYMLFGFWGQIKPVDYPSSWYLADSYLKANDPEAILLELPISTYQRYTFAGRDSASVVRKFFSNPVYQTNYIGFINPFEYTRSANDQIMLCTLNNDSACLAQTMIQQNLKFILVNRELTNLSCQPPGLEWEKYFELLIKDNDAALYQVTDNFSQNNHLAPIGF